MDQSNTSVNPQINSNLTSKEKLAWSFFIGLLIIEIILISVALSQHDDDSEISKWMAIGSSIIIGVSLLIWAIVCNFVLNGMKNIWVPAVIFIVVCLSLGFGLGFGYFEKPSTSVPTSESTSAPTSVYQKAKNAYNKKVESNMIAYMPCFVFLIISFITTIALAIKNNLWIYPKSLTIVVFFFAIAICTIGLIFNPSSQQLLTGVEYPTCNAEEPECCTDKNNVLNEKNKGLGILLVTFSLFFIILFIVLATLFGTIRSKFKHIASAGFKLKGKKGMIAGITISSIMLAIFLVPLGLGIGILTTDLKLINPSECPS